MKKLLIPAALGLLMGGVALAANSNEVATNVQVQEKVTICHRTNSVTNPYNKIEVSTDAVDGEGKNDHTSHTGPVATSEAVAQALKDSKTKWGDVIPNVLNWTTEGQALYDNDCNYVGQETPPGDEPNDPEDPTDPTDPETPVTPVTPETPTTPVVTVLPVTGGHGR